MYTVFAILIIITSILLVLVVLVQNPKGGGYLRHLEGVLETKLWELKNTDF